MGILRPDFGFHFWLEQHFFASRETYGVDRERFRNQWSLLSGRGKYIWFDNLKKEDNIDTGTCWKLFILTEIDSDCVDLARRLNMETNSNPSTT